MRLSDEIKAKRLHRLYRVLFWLLFTVPMLLVPFCAWAQNNLVRSKLELSEWSRTHDIPFEIASATQRDIQATIDTHTTIILVSVLAFVFSLLLPLLYRLLLYILHGKAAFDKRPEGTRPQSSPPPRSERSPGSEHTGTKPDPFTVLGIHRNATFDEIKRAYRKKMTEYHPDKVAALGAELRELAERKAKQINEAFEFLSRQHSTA